MEWRTIPGFPDCYEVSDEGQIRTWLKRGTGKRLDVPAPIVGYPIRGYPTALLRDLNGSRKNIRFHSAVLFAFVGPRPPGQECRHLNGKKNDNRLANLAWGTPSENSQDRWRHGTMCAGSASVTARLSAEDALGIRGLLRRGYGLDFVAGLYDVNKSTVVRIRDGLTWKPAALVAALEAAPEKP